MDDKYSNGTYDCIIEEDIPQPEKPMPNTDTEAKAAKAALQSMLQIQYEIGALLRKQRKEALQLGTQLKVYKKFNSDAKEIIKVIEKNVFSQESASNKTMDDIVKMQNSFP